MVPKRKKREKMNVRDGSQIRSSSHLQFVRGFVCSILGRGEHVCEGRIEAAHVRTGTDGGTGLKPSDCYVIPLCAAAHAEQHRIGEGAFEARYGIDMKALADRLWKISRHSKKFAA